VPWFGALSLLQRPLHCRGIQHNSCPAFVYWALAQLSPPPAFWFTKFPGQKNSPSDDARTAPITPGSSSKSTSGALTCRSRARSKTRLCGRAARCCCRRTRTRTYTNPNDTEANATGRRGVRVCSANGTCENHEARAAKSKSLAKSEALAGGANSGNAVLIVAADAVLVAHHFPELVLIWLPHWPACT